MWKWIPTIVIFALALVYIYKTEDKTPPWEDKSQIEYLQELKEKRRAKKGKFYEKVI